MRRATIEDLAGLRALWSQARLPVPALEKTLTEFQVAARANGALIACAGLQLDGQQGRIHTLCRSFKQAQQDWTNKVFRQAKALRIISIVIAAMLLILTLWLLWRLRFGLAGRVKP